MTTISITDLGPASFGAFVGYSISDTGVIVRTVSNGPYYNDFQVTETLNGVTTTLAGNGEAGVISRNGQWVGGLGFDAHYGNAVYWHNGTLTTVGPINPALSQVMAIDNSGDVGGNITLAGTNQQEGFFQAQGGAFTLISVPGVTALQGSQISQVTAMNDSGQVVGSAAFDTSGADWAYVWQNGAITRLAALSGWNESVANAINDKGDIVGAAGLPLSTFGAAILWSGGKVTALATLPGASQGTTAYSINDQDQIVGEAGMSDGSQHAVLWQNGTVTDLNTLLPANSGWVLNSADQITDQGLILGYGTHDGVQTSFLLDIAVPAAALPAVAAFQAGTLTAPAQISAASTDVVSNLDALQAMAAAGKLASISLTDGGTPVLTLSDTQLAKDTGALRAITGNFSVSVNATGTNLALAGLPGHQTIVDFSAPASVYKITYAGGVFTVTDLATGRASTDTLSGVAGLKFGDGSEIFATSPDMTAKIVNPGTFQASTGLTAMAVDPQGNILGNASYPAPAAAIAVYWTNSQFVTLNPDFSSGQNASTDFAISADGWAVGDVRQAAHTNSSDNPGTPPEAALWKLNSQGNFGQPAQLGYLQGDVASIASDINASHQIVGISYTASAVHGFLWQNGAMTGLGSLGGTTTYALRINASGEVIGFSDTAAGVSHAFLWQNGAMTDLGTLSGGGASSANAINASGLIVGTSTDASGATHAVTWSGGKIGELPGLAGSAGDVASDVNAQGVIVGTSNGEAVAWQNGVIVDLNSLLPAGSGWKLTTATAVNDAGQVIGQGTDNGAAAAFELTLPAALPVSAAAAAASFAAGSVSGPVTITDSAAAIGANLDGLQRMAAAADLGQVTLTDTGVPTVPVTAAQLASDGKALSEVKGYYVLAISAADHGVTVAGLAGEGDVLVIDGAAANYRITATGSGFTLSGAAGSDQISNVQAIAFSDHTDIVAAAPGPADAVTTGNLTELYGAVFGRTPDVAGLAYYQAELAANPSIPLISFAQTFLASPEYTGNSAHVYAQSPAGDAQFIADSYQNLLHRAPEAGAVGWYEANVIEPTLAGATAGTPAYAQAETLAHARILVDFSASAEFLNTVQVTATTPSDARHWLILV